MLHGAVISDFFQHRVRSVPLLEEAVDAFVLVGDEWSLAMAAMLQGALKLVERDSTRAPDGLRGAARRFEALDNPWGRSYALRHLADVLVVRGHYDEAAAALHDAVVGLAPSVGSASPAASPPRLGYISALMGRADDAERWLDEALDAAERQRYVPNLALIHNLRGVVLRRSGRLDEAARCHEQAMDLYSDRGVRPGSRCHSTRWASSPSCVAMPRRRASFAPGRVGRRSGCGRSPHAGARARRPGRGRGVER